MSGKNFDVFISYRHSDGKDKAISLEANFEKAGCRTFRDDNELRRGAFDKRIEIAVLDAPVFVMVLTSDYFQRCNQEGDWVRREIDLAIENGKVIIPINYNGVLKGVPDYLDEEFRKKVGCHNFIALHTDTSFKATLREIIDRDIKPNISIVVNNNNRAKLSVKTDANCKLIEDDEIIATLQEGTTKQIFVEKGEHEFIARSIEYNDIEQSIEKLIDDINSKYLLKITLAEQIEKRKKEQIEKHINEYKLLKTLDGHSKSVKSVAYSPDGTKIISGSYDKTVKIWDANTGQCLETLEGHSSWVYSVAYSPDGTKIISGSFKFILGKYFWSDDKSVGEIKIWDANTGECLKTLGEHSDFLESVSYSPDGTKIISNSGDGTIDIWDANTGECLKTLEGHSYGVYSVAYSPDGTKIISGSADKTIKIWDANTGQCLKTLNGHSKDVYSVAYSPDGTKIISGSWDENIKIWDANTGQCLKTLEGHSNWVNSVAYSSDGTKIISGSEDKTIKIWNANTGKCLKTLKGHSNSVFSVAYSPDGTKIISGSNDNTVKIWGVE